MGHIYHWNKESCEEYLTINTEENKTVEKILTNPYNKDILGVGGDFNDIKLYDINTKKIVFAGKAVSNINYNFSYILVTLILFFRIATMN